MEFLSPLNQSQPRPWLADWFEFCALLFGFVRFEDHLDEVEPSDEFSDEIDTEEQIKTDIYEKAFEEICRRQNWVGDAYPFLLEDGGLTLRLSPRLSPGMDAYLLCLWLSVAASDILQDGCPKVSLPERALFQSCATLTAAAYFGGKAFSFDFPRPKGGNILQGLSDLHAEGFPEGIPKRSYEPWMNAAAKDDEVDVIAWRGTNDTLPGAICLYGQSASGDNWDYKQLSTNTIQAFRNQWYELVPGTDPLRAIFIPFCPWPDIIDKGMSSYKKRLSTETIRFGIIFTRYRLPHFLDKHFRENLGETNLDRALIATKLRVWRVDLIKKFTQ